MAQIRLTKGYYTQVDEEDILWLLQWEWYAHVGSERKIYAARSKYTGLGSLMLSLIVMVILTENEYGRLYIIDKSVNIAIVRTYESGVRETKYIQLTSNQANLFKEQKEKYVNYYCYVLIWYSPKISKKMYRGHQIIEPQIINGIFLVRDIEYLKCSRAKFNK